MATLDLTPPEFEILESVAPATPSIPHSREAEEALLGSVLIFPDLYLELAFLKPADFYIHRHGWIWESFGKLYEKRTPVDLITLAEQLDKDGKLNEIGGPAYITSLINCSPTSLNGEHYANIVKEHSERRKGINAANNLAVKAYDESKTFSLREYAMGLMQSEGGKSTRVTPKMAASRAIDQMIQNPRFGLWGIPDLDKAVGGQFPDELNILAGYQGTGKTALMLHSARKNADAGKRVTLASLEMSAAQIWFRIACGDMGVDMNQVRNGSVDAETRQSVIDQACNLADKYEGKIFIYEDPLTLPDILSATIIDQPDVVYVDHVGLISGKEKGMNLMEWYNLICRFLRQNVAKGEHVNVTALHQLNRSAFRETRRPSKHDLAFAGENDADGIYLLYRAEAEEGIIQTVAPIEVIVDKSRFGWTGTQKANFDLPHQKFYGTQYG